MGDVGSVLIGFVYAAVTFLIARDFLDFLCLAGFLLPFYMDEITTMAVRLRDGENLTKAHRRHIYQILVNEFGIPHWKISAAYGLVQTIVCLSIILAKARGPFGVMISYMIFCTIFVTISVIIRKKADVK